MDAEKHRTLLSAADLEGSRQILGRCVVTTVDTALGPAGSGLVLPSEPPDDDDSKTGWQMTPPIGRFNQVHTWDGQGDRSRARSVEAMIFPVLDKTHTMVTWDGQNFAAFCTEWENQNSPLVNFTARPSPTPVVDGCGVVVGYYLKKVSTKYLFATDAGAIFYTGYVLSHPTYTVNTQSIAGQNIYLTPADEPVYTTGKIGGYKAWIRGDKWADLLLDIDGFVVAIDMYGDEKKKSWADKYNEAVDGVPLLGWVLPRIPVPPSDKCFGEVDQDMVGYEAWEAQCSAEMTGFFTDSMFLVMDLITLGESKAARKLLSVGRKAMGAAERAGKAAMRGARATAVALTLELKAPKPVLKTAAKVEAKRLLLPDGRLAEGVGLRVTKGYDAAMGIPKSHFLKMVEAAKEAKGIAVFRANKSAAIPLIEGGAHPKPKHYNAFKTSKETGVLTAKEPAHVELAYQKGDYVVDDDLVPRRTMMKDGKKVTEQLTLKNPSWKLEKGQVIKADGKPIVGDYDLLGFLPNESPGRNITSVPKGHVPDDVKGDWVGPDVQRYQKAVNAKFDQPRVLHGAQDGFQHSQYGGLTDDVAYAIYGDGSAVILNGRQAQEAYYAAYRRQTAMGQHPRPSPGTPVVDELAARRARNAGK